MLSSKEASVQSGSAISKSVHLSGVATKGGNNQNTFIIPFILCAAASLGAMQVTQSGINIHFGKWAQHPLRAAFISCFVGATCLLPFCLFCRPKGDVEMIQNLGNALKKDGRNYLVFLNGATNVFWLSAAIYVPPQIGFSLHIISVIMGQIITSSLIDHYGLIWSDIKKLSVFNICGILVAMIGVIVFKIPKFIDKDVDHIDIYLFIYMITAMFAGAGFTIQAALNRRLRVMMNSTPYQSSFALFLNATLILLVINIVVYGINGDWFEVDPDEFFWYIFCGGMFGSCIVSLYIICPEYIGFVPTYTCAIFGSLVTSLVYDSIDAFGLNKNGPEPIHMIAIAGVIVMFIGTVMVNIKRGQQIHKDPGSKSTELSNITSATGVQSLPREYQSFK